MKPSHVRSRFLMMSMSWLVAAPFLGCAQTGGSGTPAGEGGSGGSLSGAGGTASGSGGNGGGMAAAGGSGAAGAGAGGATGRGGSGAGGRAGAGGSTATGGRGGVGGSTGAGGTSGVGGSIGTGGTGGATTTGITCTPQSWNTSPVGWATVSGGTTGGGTATPSVVTTLGQLNSAAGGTGQAVIHVSGTISGTVRVGSNKTILGLCGAQVHGSIDLTGSSNVIVRNLTVVGFNCTDSPSDCSAGADAVHVEAGDHHLWFDHMDISDGSDGNLDITHGCDFITISWVKFHYSSRRTDPVAGSTGHRFCDLIGHDDNNAAEDTGHLNVTFDHVWWADNVNQRMPRVRFGKVHVFNSLYTASGDSACIEVGVSSNIRSESNVFQGVGNTVDSTHANAASVIQSIGNLGSSTSIGGPAFTPSYSYTLDAVGSVAATVMAGAGPK